MKTGRFAIISILGLFIFFSCFANAKPITLKFNYSMPLKKSIAGSWHWYGNELEKQSNGRVKFQFFPLGGLFKAKETRDNIIAGTADIAKAGNTPLKKWHLECLEALCNYQEGLRRSAPTILQDDAALA